MQIFNFLNKKNIFLTANWYRLSSINFEVNPEVLKKYIPHGTVLDSYKQKHFVSLVCFRYCNTKILGIKIPFHHKFEEINLRFYVKREIKPGIWRKEVAFTHLFFPKKALTFVARHIYKENYRTVKMSHFWKEKKDKLITEYRIKNTKWSLIKLITKKHAKTTSINSDEEYFNSHIWGTAKTNKNESTSYKIEHPEWKIYQIIDFEIKFDFADIFGDDFKFLNNTYPHSVMLTKGSKVIVKKKKMI